MFELYIDHKITEEIYDFFRESANKKKLRIITETISRGTANSKLYEKYNKIADNVSVIKISRGAVNARIYCQHNTEEDVVKIVMAYFLPKKKSQDLTKKIKDRLIAISKYRYEYQSLK